MWSQTCGKTDKSVCKVTSKTIICKIRTFMGQIQAVTHFVTHFTHVSRHFGVESRKQKNCLGKTVLKMWSQNNQLCPQNLLKIVNAFIVLFFIIVFFYLQFYLFYFFSHFLWTLNPFLKTFFQIIVLILIFGF